MNNVVACFTAWLLGGIRNRNKQKNGLRPFLIIETSKMRQFIKILVILFIAIFYSSTITSKQYMGKITIKVGEEYYVEAVPKTPDYSAEGSWTKSNSHFVLATAGRNSCRIRGNTAGSGILSYSGYVYATGWWQVEHYDLYWDVEVQANSKPDSDPDPGSDPGSNPDIPDEPTEKWSDGGNYSYSWYKKDLEEYTISTNKELAGMAYLINNGYTDFKDKTIKLSADIDLSGKKWVQCKTFYGTFDGQGHIVYGVYMGNDVDEQTQFGFWRTISYATIKDVILQGVVNVRYERAETYLGGLVGQAGSSSIIQNCIVDMDVFYDRDEKTSYYGNHAYIGGICGGGFSDISNCIFKGSITVRASTGNPYIGGISAQSESMKYCESFISRLSAKTRNVLGVDWTISGIGEARSSIKYCRSIIENIDVACGWSGSEISSKEKFYIGGITRRYNYPSVINCYSSIHKAKFTSKNGSQFLFGGVCSDGGCTACFSNADVDIDCNATLTRGFDGSTGFTSEQMKTSAFLEELNMYSTLEMDGPVWKQNVGEYPYINDFKYNGPVSHDDKCATPIISYLNRKLIFECETEGVEFKSYITDTDIREYNSSAIDLTATYYISVYATKEGYEDSDVATATLCWIDVEPYAEGTKEAEDAITEVKAMPILIQTNGKNITVQGVVEGMGIDVYSIDGIKHGSAVAGKERTTIPTNLLSGSTAIVKVGDKAVKVIVK